MFIFQKLIDRSTLLQGFEIPVNNRPVWEAVPLGLPKYKESRHIKIVIQGISFDAQLKNQRFDQNKFDHSPVIQIRYNTYMAKYLQKVFNSTWEYVNSIKNLPENANRKCRINIPEDQQEFLALSSTDQPNVFVADCITSSAKAEVAKDFQTITELDFETFEPREDKGAGIKEVTRLQKVRQLDRSIGDSLKLLYDYRCQMTGERIGEPYSALVVEAHHIVPFTQSLNNDTSNIIILSPTYHRIIHKTNPEWLPKQLAFKFPNGLVEKVKLNKHL